MSFTNLSRPSSHKQGERPYINLNDLESRPAIADEAGYIPQASESRSRLVQPDRQQYPPSELNAEELPDLPSRAPRGDSYTKSEDWDPSHEGKGLMRPFDKYESRSSSNIRMASDDDNKVVRFYYYLLGVSVVTRWFLYIVPILGLLWIPGILHYTLFPEATVWSVQLHWWSIWLSVWWGSWWISLVCSLLLPWILRYTLGVVMCGTMKYIDWLAVLYRYFAFCGWALTSWVSFKPLVDNHNQDNGITPITAAKRATTTIFTILFGLVLCAVILFAEKVLIQQIASAYHELSYAERLDQQRAHTRVLVALYEHSTDQRDRSDTLHDDAPGTGKLTDPKRILRSALRGVRGVAKTTTQAFGNIASEIVGSSMLQPNSPQAMVENALQSANKTRLLARRLFYSFKAPNADVIVLDDITRYFPDTESAAEAFSFFDEPANGDVTREEIEVACIEVHRERLALASSMLDIDSAVSRLDNIFMSLYFAVAIVIMAVTLDAHLARLVSGAGAILLALSWLIGGSAQEVLTSIIFLFVKHMYDVGDRIEIGKDKDKESFVVKEIRLLSTIFIDARGCQVQAPHLVLNTQMIYNLRRSPPMSESFELDVAYATTFEQIEQLREKMLEFIKTERREYMPSFDVVVQDFPGQGKMVLRAEIKYKSNWQQGALKVQRRNKWVCALKNNLKEVGIFGPSGDPSAKDKDKDKDKAKEEAKPKQETIEEPPIPRAQYLLQDQNAVVLDDSRDVFNESQELHMTNPRQERPGVRKGIEPTAPHKGATGEEAVGKSHR